MSMMNCPVAEVYKVFNNRPISSRNGIAKKQKAIFDELAKENHLSQW